MEMYFHQWTNKGCLVYVWREYPKPSFIHELWAHDDNQDTLFTWHYVEECRGKVYKLSGKIHLRH